MLSLIPAICDTPIDAAIRLAIQYNCLNVATALVDMCNVRVNTPRNEDEVMLFKLLDAQRACPLLNMAHAFGLTESVDLLTNGLVLLATAKPTCCCDAHLSWKGIWDEKSCPFECQNAGWRSEGYLEASKVERGMFADLNGPLQKLLFAKFFDEVRMMTVTEVKCSHTHAHVTYTYTRTHAWAAPETASYW
jgi:hypothetical protein